MEYHFPLHRDMILNSNTQKGKHWGASAPKTKDLRELANAHRINHKIPRYERVQVDAHITYPDLKPHDVANLYPTMKAYVDGLVNDGKGILKDDSDVFLEGPFMHWTGNAPDRKDFYTFAITITEIPMRPIQKGAVGPKMKAFLTSVGVELQ